MGGVGKSRLADEFLHECLLAGRRVQWVSVGPGMNEEELARAMVTAAKPRERAEADLTMVELCVDVSRDLDVVLVDAAERSVSAAAALILRLHDACPRLQVVVTSRLPLEIMGESVLKLTGLGTDGPLSDVYQLVADRLGIEVEAAGEREQRLCSTRSSDGPRGCRSCWRWQPPRSIRSLWPTTPRCHRPRPRPPCSTRSRRRSH